MYHPYLRGRQNELILVRENAALMAEAGFVPIIEPVKAATSGFARALSEVAKADGEAIIVANPAVGDFKEDGADLQAHVAVELAGNQKLAVGLRIGVDTELTDVVELAERFSAQRLAVLHCGHPSGKAVHDALRPISDVSCHIFLDGVCGTLYRRHFKGSRKILIRDGFQRRTNREYPEIEPYSELHLTFREEGADGFGDYLIVGDEFQEAGGPAYAVAIHLTYIDSGQEDAMFVRHFVSNTVHTPQDPAGKFREALTKLAAVIHSRSTPFYETRALNEFLELHRQGHFPGLGVVKKLSMQHHIETLAQFMATHSPESR